MSEQPGKAFDPGQHLSQIKGQDYLEVKWRLAWLRSEEPDAIIETRLESHLEDRAIFYARIALPGGASATGWGSETAGSFGNYIEKAETKAIGRACAALGFGTQFCDDFSDGPEHGSIADAPVQLRRSQSQQRPPRTGSGPEPATGPQRGKIGGLAKDIGMPDPVLAALVKKVTGTPLPEISKAQASAVIDELTRRKAQGPGVNDSPSPTPLHRDGQVSIDDARNTFWSTVRGIKMPVTVANGFAQAEYGKLPADLIVSELEALTALVAQEGDQHAGAQ